MPRSLRSFVRWFIDADTTPEYAAFSSVTLTRITNRIIVVGIVFDVSITMVVIIIINQIA